MTNPSFTYLKSDGSPIPFSDGDSISADMTLLAPSSQFDVWNEELGAWEFNRDRWLNEQIRPTRNKLLDAADQRVRRYDYQIRAGIATAETTNTIMAVLAYMQVLRDLPQTAQPDSFAWPAVP